MVVVEIRRRLQHAKSVCVKRRHGAMPAWAMSAGEVLQEELAAAVCFFCCLLQVVLLLHEGTHALQSTRAYRQPEATLSKTGKKQEVWSTPLSGEAWPIQSVRKVFGQQEAAVESHIDHIWLYRNMLPKYDQLSHI